MRGLPRTLADRTVFQMDQGTSQDSLLRRHHRDAVRIQIWTALSTYLLVAILKKALKLKPSLHEILQVISVTPFEKVPIPELFARF